jgi:hypothetical protein
MVAGSIPIRASLSKLACRTAPCGHLHATLALGPRLRGDDVIGADDVMGGDDVR